MRLLPIILLAIVIISCETRPASEESLQEEMAIEEVDEETDSLVSEINAAAVTEIVMESL